MVEVRQLETDETRQLAGALGSVLKDCVEGGASVGFVLPLSQAEAEAFYRGVADGVGRGERVLLAAFLDRDVVGTVQIVPAAMPNQTHRADISKLLVARSARRMGVAKALMERAEDIARRGGRTLLTLDTCSGTDAEKLYISNGWIRSGVIPKYALYPDGRWCDTVIFWKSVSEMHA